MHPRLPCGTCRQSHIHRQVLCTCRYWQWFGHWGFSHPTESFKQANWSSKTEVLLHLKLGHFPACREERRLKCSILNFPVSPAPLPLSSFLPSPHLLLLLSSNTSESRPPSLLQAGLAPPRPPPRFSLNSWTTRSGPAQPNPSSTGSVASLQPEVTNPASL